MGQGPEAYSVPHYFLSILSNTKRRQSVKEREKERVGRIRIISTQKQLQVLWVLLVCVGLSHTCEASRTSKEDQRLQSIQRPVWSNALYCGDDALICCSPPLMKVLWNQLSMYFITVTPLSGNLAVKRYCCLWLQRNKLIKKERKIVRGKGWEDLSPPYFMSWFCICYLDLKLRGYRCIWKLIKYRL